MIVNDSIAIKNSDSLQVTMSHILEVDQEVSSKLDFINATILQQDSLQFTHTDQLESLSTLLKSIVEYGVGYSDTAAHIAIPLIIALFAFAFPFLFMVITNINNKYDSKHISWMFAQEWSYKWFIKGVIICASYLFVAGLLSLCFKGLTHTYKVYMCVLDWTSIVIAGAYSVVIICFAKTCIQYNTPEKMVETIERHYLNGGKNVESYLKKLKRQEHKNKKEKSETKRRFNAMRLHIGKSFAYYNTNEARIKRLSDFGKYTLRRQDYELFLSVVIKMDNLAKEGKINGDRSNEHWIAMFYEEIVEVYLFCPKNSKVEDTLMMYWFAALNHSQEPNPVIIYNMLGKIVNAVQLGRVSLFENYMQKAQYGYSFINHLQIVSYVRGCNEQTQKHVNESRLKFWSELCEIHYLALAYLFSKGNAEAVRIVLSGQNMGYDKMIPSDGSGILKLYSRCKENKPDNSNYSNYYHLKDVIGENTDPDMLEKLTALLLLMASEPGYYSMNLISPSSLQLIYKAKEKILRYGKMWSVAYKTVFPEMGNNDIDDLFDVYVKQLEEGAKIEGKGDDHNLLVRWFYAFLRVLLGKEEVKQDVYEKPLPKEMMENVKIMFWNILYGNKGYIENGLTGTITDDKTEHKLMGVMTFMAYKHALMESDGIHSGRVFNNMLNIFRSRYLYIMYQALSKMMVEEKTIRMEDFHNVFLNYVGDNASEYVILDNNASISTFYGLDNPTDGCKFTYRRTYHGADYHHFDQDIDWYLKDVPEMCSYDKTIIIVKKSDLPVIVALDNTDGPDVTFKDESDKQKGIAAVSLTINPNYEIRYGEKTSYLRLKLTLR